MVGIRCDFLDRREEEGTFDCTECGDRTFHFIRTYRVWYVGTFRAFSRRTGAQRLICATCGAQHPVAVLASQARRIESPSVARRRAGRSIWDYFGNLCTLSPSACAEIRRRLAVSCDDAATAVRLVPAQSGSNRWRIWLVRPELSACDWMGKSGGYLVLVNRRHAAALVGARILYRKGAYIAVPRDEPTPSSRLTWLTPQWTPQTSNPVVG